MSPLLQVPLLVLAGIVGGAMGTAVAITTLVTFPAMRLMGIDPITASEPTQEQWAA